MSTLHIRHYFHKALREDLIYGRLRRGVNLRCWEYSFHWREQVSRFDAERTSGEIYLIKKDPVLAALDVADARARNPELRGQIFLVRSAARPISPHRLKPNAEGLLEILAGLLMV